MKPNNQFTEISIRNWPMDKQQKLSLEMLDDLRIYMAHGDYINMMRLWKFRNVRSPGPLDMSDTRVWMDMDMSSRGNYTIPT